ncbi:hypothetical protein Cgig2_012811 [Carnegiea gigantea]|uniref:Plastid lipid-associated protein/fibrillin conserved domain-containing protein n=1 Tax=Carnegiea gigantea TaxID=171969 RepID=A0A9Q1KBE3_9CARY|nr:hypothetical protein Cgig2_012811 [Carnegiea gigantea]
MAFAVAPFFGAVPIKKVSYWTNFPIPTPTAVRKHHNKTFWRCSSSATSAATTINHELETKKYNLLTIIQDTERGLKTTANQRSSIEEAMVRFSFYFTCADFAQCYIELIVIVEGYEAGEPIELEKLDGTWRLQYTSAPDVLVLFEVATRLPFLQVGQIFQKFECSGQSKEGVVKNIIKWSIRNLLEENEGATLIVSAKFSLVSRRNIYLQFEEIELQDIRISEQLQALIAPALLPRTYLSLQILQFIRSFKAQVPVNSPVSSRQSVGGLYYLSYFDDNMLLGRAVGGGGVFIFTRAQPFVC